jgi:nicotinamide riboside kinase
LYELEKKVTYDQYFLMDIDVAWVEDGLRDLGHDRDRMYEVFRLQLERRNIPYIPARGTWKERQHVIQTRVDLMLGD